MSLPRRPAVLVEDDLESGLMKMYGHERTLISFHDPNNDEDLEFVARWRSSNAVVIARSRMRTRCGNRMT